MAVLLDRISAVPTSACLQNFPLSFPTGILRSAVQGLLAQELRPNSGTRAAALEMAEAQKAESCRRRFHSGMDRCGADRTKSGGHCSGLGLALACYAR